VDGEAPLRIVVGNLSQQAFYDEVEGGIPLGASHLYSLAVESLAPEPGECALDLLVTDYAFDTGPRAQAGLGRLMELGARARCPILAAATGSATKLETASEEALMKWNALQRRPDARWIGLGAPRLLVREPYGSDSDPIDAFRFEEVAGPGRTEDYCWGSPCTGLACAAARALSISGDLSQMPRYCELEGLPMHVTGHEAETAAVGPVDEVLTEPKLEAWTLMGLIPITGIRGTDSARILALRSLAGSSLFSGS
jgi:type VI secretion system protein ImpC